MSIWKKNTKEFADDIIFSLMETAAEYGIYGEKKINLKLAYSGDMKEYPDKISEFPNFVFRNKDKFVAIYEYVKGEITENYFLSFSRTESYYDYGHLYFKLDTLLELFDKYGVYYNIITTMDKSIPSLHRKDDYTQFIIGTDPSIKSYNEEKEEERKNDSNIYKLIKRRLNPYKKR